MFIERFWVWAWQFLEDDSPFNYVGPRTQNSGQVWPQVTLPAEPTRWPTIKYAVWIWGAWNLSKNWGYKNSGTGSSHQRWSPFTKDTPPRWQGTRYPFTTVLTPQFLPLKLKCAFYIPLPHKLLFSTLQWGSFKWQFYWMPHYPNPQTIHTPL